MNTSMKTSLDNLLMTTLIVTSLLMATLGPALTSRNAQTVIGTVSASTPAAMQPLLEKDAAIIVTAPRLHRAA